jgi:hypothetical protein
LNKSPRIEESDLRFQYSVPTITWDLLLFPSNLVGKSLLKKNKHVYKGNINLYSLVTYFKRKKIEKKAIVLSGIFLTFLLLIPGIIIAYTKGLSVAGSMSWTGVAEGEIYEWKTTKLDNETFLDFYHDFNLSRVTDGNLLAEKKLYPEDISSASVNGLDVTVEIWNLTADIPYKMGPEYFYATSLTAESILRSSGVRWECANFTELLFNGTIKNMLEGYGMIAPFVRGVFMWEIFYLRRYIFFDA